MTSILAVHGSPRRGGNTDLLLKRAAEGARGVGAAVRLIRAAELNISGCRGCEGCRESGRCVIDDPMQEYYDPFMEAEGYIFATPVYGWGPSGQIKTFLDRLYCLIRPLQERDETERKYAAVITAFGAPEPSTADETVNMFGKICRYVRIDLVGDLRVTAQQRGEVRQKPGELARAGRLGRTLAQKAGPPGS